MERIMTVEEKIKKAEEIYNRRRENENKNVVQLNKPESKKRNSPLKKMRNQVIICLVIYGIINFILSNNYAFSREVKTKVNEILSYDISFDTVINNIVAWWDNMNNTTKQDSDSIIIDNTIIEENNINT